MGMSIKELPSRPAEIANIEGMSFSLENMARQGAREMIRQAIEAEVAAFTASYAHVATTGGQQVVVRNGYQPERDILTAAGPVTVKAACGYLAP